MTLSHKLGQIFSLRGWRSVRHSLHRWLHPISPPKIQATIDLEKLQTIRSRHGIDGEQTRYQKYLDLERFLRMNIRRIQDLRLNIAPPQHILDLGSGAGWFLFAAKSFGHTGMGLDLPEPEMFSETFSLFGLKRIAWKIEPMTPLPPLGQRFNLITAFSICFNGHKSSRVWGVPEWEFLLNDLQKNLLEPGGRIYFDLNPEADGSSVTPPLKAFFLQRGAPIDRSKVSIPSPIVP